MMGDEGKKYTVFQEGRFWKEGVPDTWIEVEREAYDKAETLRRDYQKSIETIGRTMIGLAIWPTSVKTQAMKKVINFGVK